MSGSLISGNLLTTLRTHGAEIKRRGRSLAGQGLQQGLFQGLSQAGQTMGQFFEDQANQTKPLVRVAAGTPIVSVASELFSNPNALDTRAA